MGHVPHPLIDLTDPTLFGNDAAEDEREDIFYSYAIDRPEVAEFSNASRSICVAHAYKGEGKSGLLILTRRRVSSKSRPLVSVSRTASELAPELVSDDYPTWVRGWKKSLLTAIASEIGATIGVAWTDDAMALVEESEKSGSRSRSILSSILDRLTLPAIPISGGAIGLPARRVVGSPSPQETIKRWNKERVEIWLFVDDVDKNFENRPNVRMRIASFFDAARELTNVIPELRVRTTVRPNVWAILKREFESLSHIQQYVSDIAWSEDEARRLFAKRIEAYLNRNQSQWTRLSKGLPDTQADRDKAVIGFVFDSPMLWGKTNRPAHVVLYTLSKHRPRWMVELAKVAAREAKKLSRTKITREDIVRNLSAFGGRRIEDTVAEFRSQCDQVEELISAFSRGTEQYSTDELLNLIERKILSHLHPRIADITGKVTSRHIASFLFEIGLYYGRRDEDDGSYGHVAFRDRPSLLQARSNLDDGLKWEIHPVFRQALEIRDESGRETKRPKPRRP